jgi:uncharacterized OB-fold protein
MNSALTKPFWDGAQQGRLVIQFDTKSGLPQFYPRPVSLASGSEDMAWREVSPDGRIAAATSLSGPDPGVLAMVELDAGVRLLSRILGDPTSARPGARVRLTWLPRADGPPMFAFVVL